MFLSLIEKRRSVRSFMDTPVEQDKIDVLMEAALMAPSSMGMTPWEFVVVRDASALRTLSGAKPHGASFLARAPVGIVVCADPARSDVWVEDASIAAAFMQLAAESIGLGSCWIQIRGRRHDDSKWAQDVVREVIGLPAHLEVDCIVAVGYPAERKAPRRKDKLRFQKVHMERYGTTGQGTDR